MLESEQACANAIEGLLPLPSTIQIQVVYVSVRVDDQGGTFDTAYGAKAIDALSAAYARAGFSFTLAAQYAANFSSVGDVGVGQCGVDAAEVDCERCTAYKKASSGLQTQRTLFIYGVPASSECAEGGRNCSCV